MGRERVEHMFVRGMETFDTMAQKSENPEKVLWPPIRDIASALFVLACDAVYGVEGKKNDH